jgi:hypothetical protein
MALVWAEAKEKSARKTVPTRRSPDSLVANEDRNVPKLLQRLGWIPRDIADELTRKGVALDLGGSVYNANDPVGKLLFNVLGMIAEFESDLIRARTHEGMAVAKAKGRLRGKPPKLSKA